MENNAFLQVWLLPNMKASNEINKSLILASASAYRRMLLERLRLPFEIKPVDMDESALSDESPKQLAQRLALGKAELAIGSNNSAVIIGSDQVCACGDVIMGKPGGWKKARDQLALCSGRHVHFYTAMCVINAETQDVFQTVDVTEVIFRTLTQQQIDGYLQIDQPYDCAGSFKVESLGVALFEKINTQDPTALIGLPLIQLCQMLRACGLDPLAS